MSLTAVLTVDMYWAQYLFFSSLNLVLCWCAKPFNLMTIQSEKKCSASHVTHIVTKPMTCACPNWAVDLNYIHIVLVYAMCIFIVLDKDSNRYIFFISVWNPVGSHKKHLTKVLLMSTHNIFSWKNNKNKKKHICLNTPVIICLRILTSVCLMFQYFCVFSTWKCMIRTMYRFLCN